MNKLLQLLDRVLAVFCVSLSSFLVFCVVWQVFSRYVLNSPSTSTDEMARFLFIWVGLMGAAYTLGKKRHLAIDLLSIKLEDKPAKLAILNILITAISLCFASIVMVYGGGGLMMKTLSTGQVSPALGVQMGFVYAAIPLSGLIMAIYLFRDLGDNLKTFASAR